MACSFDEVRRDTLGIRIGFTCPHNSISARLTGRCLLSVQLRPLFPSFRHTERLRRQPLMTWNGASVNPMGQKFRTQKFATSCSVKQKYSGNRSPVILILWRDSFILRTCTCVAISREQRIIQCAYPATCQPRLTVFLGASKKLRPTS